jgi:hypothetical protein
LLGAGKHAPLTQAEKNYLKKHGYHEGQEILPIVQELPGDAKIRESISKKMEITFLIFESSNKEKL